MTSFDSETGVVSTDDGWKLLFQGNNILLEKGVINLSVSYEPMVGGTTIAVYNDLEIRGVEQHLAQTAIAVINNTLENMGFTVIIQ